MKKNILNPMKHLTTPVFVSLFVLMQMAAFAQTYKPVITQGQVLYVNSFKEIFALKVDSQRVVGGDSIFYLNRNLETIKVPNRSDFCYRPQGNNWLGGRLVAKPNGNYWFFTKYGDTVRISSTSNVGDTWELLRSRRDSMVVKLTDSLHGIENVLGQTDSIKYLRLKIFDLNNQPISHQLQNRTLKLSKRFGLVEAISFRDLGRAYTAYTTMGSYNQPIVTLTGISLGRKGTQNLTWKDIHSYQVGDELHIRYFKSYNGIQSSWGNTDTTYQIYKIQSVWTNGDTTYYKRMIQSKMIKVARNIFSYTSTPTVTSFRQPDLMDTLKTYANHYLDSISCYIVVGGPGIIEGFNHYGSSAYSLYEIKQGVDGFNNKMKTFKPLPFTGPTTCSSWIIDALDYLNDQFLEGKGGPYFSRFTYYGASLIEVLEQKRELMYWKKGSAQGGTSVLPIILSQKEEEYSSAPSFSIYPNPSTGLVEIKTSEGEVNVYDIYMRKVASIWVNQTSQTADLSFLQPGLYWLESNGKKVKWVKE